MKCSRISENRCYYYKQGSRNKHSHFFFLRIAKLNVYVKQIYTLPLQKVTSLVKKTRKKKTFKKNKMY